MAEPGSDHQPMSLNEKNNRLLKDLSTNRSPHRRNEIRVRKVKIEGRRRLCKLSSTSPADDDNPSWLDSPPKQEIDEKWVDSPVLPKAKTDGGDSEESIRDILDDLTSRMDSLSVQKPKPRPRAARESPVEYESAPSSFSPSPEKKVTPKERDGSKGKGSMLSLSSTGRGGSEGKASSLSLSPDKKVASRERGGSEGKTTSLSFSPDKKVASRERSGSEGKASSHSLSPDKKVASRERGGSKGKASSLSLSPDRKVTLKEGAGMKGKAVAPKVSKASEEEDDDGSCEILDRKQHHEWSDDGFDNETVVDDVVEAFRLPGTGVSRSRTYELSGKIVKMLYPHQRDGLKWLWSLHCGGTGGILGDDMGLGKTMQLSAFLAGLFHSRLIKRSLIVAPKTLLAHWMKELSVVGLANKTRDFSGTCTKTRQYELQAILKEGGVLLTTYDIVRNNLNSIKGEWCADIDQSEDDIVWDYVVLDEGHVIKNPKTQRAKSLHEIPSVHRIIISGTPIQNNLKELWALFNFCCPEILGDKNMFKTRYEYPILRGNDKNASDRDKHVGSTVAKQLRERIKPYFLRRLKSEVFVEDDSGKNDKISKKSEIIVWLRLTSCQRQLYEAFLNSDLVHSAVDGSPLAALTILKKICDHPLLLTKKAAEGVLEGMDTMLNRDELSMVETMATNLANMTEDDGALQVDQNVSCKLCFILSLLKKLVEEDHTVLIFSQTRKMLNLIQDAIISEGYKFLRIDGTTKLSDRERIVKDFQEGSGAPIFLLTSQVGGLGLTLTKADRVIVVDPAWNPSTDNQSVDRAYRIGQTKDVIVYRLMTCGTIEEKIYKMQIFKGGLFRTATEQKEQTRYFSQKDIKELFSLPEQGFDVSLTQKQLHEEHDQHHILNDSFREHINYLEKQGIAGVSHHSLIYSKTAMVPIVPETIEVQSKTANIIVRSSQSGSSVEHVVNGSEYAFKPKDLRFAPRPHTSNVTVNDITSSPEYIEDRIKRLSQTLANKGLISNLPDRGDRIKKQISELNKQLCEIRDTPPSHASQKNEKEIIDLDNLSEDLQRVLSV